MESKRPNTYDWKKNEFDQLKLNTKLNPYGNVKPKRCTYASKAMKDFNQREYERKEWPDTCGNRKRYLDQKEVTVKQSRRQSQLIQPRNLIDEILPHYFR